MPAWRDTAENWVSNWVDRIEGFYNLGSRIVKFHMAPGTMVMRNYRLDAPILAGVGTVPATRDRPRSSGDSPRSSA